MERIKSFVGSALITLIVFAGFGFGIMAVGFAIVLGAALALTLRLAGPSLIKEAENRAEEMREEAEGVEPAAA